MWRKGDKYEKVGFVLGFLLLSAFLIYFVIMAWKTNIIFGLVLLGVVLAATIVAGLAYLVLLGVVWAVVYGAMKGAINEVKNFLKEMRG